MASNPTASPHPGDSTVVDRLERIVNTDQFADVTFRVGEPGELMFGHKVILAEASEVFRAQFTGAFRESRENVREQAIPVVDIEPAVFQELLRYMYSGRVNVTVENVLDVLYGANKYLLMKLKEVCERFLRTMLFESNVLWLFDHNRRYELEEVNRLCMDIICDNPIKIFADESFLTLSRKSVELIAARELINCQTTQLLTAVEKWIKVNEADPNGGSKLLSLVREQQNRDFMCKKMHNFSAGHYLNTFKTIITKYATGCQRVVVQRTPPLRSRSPVQLAQATQPKADFVLQIESDFSFWIYGFGVCIKSQHVLKPITLDITLVMTKNGVGQIGLPIIMKRTVTPNAKFCVEEILFEKLTVDKGITCAITIHADHGANPLFCFKTFEPEIPIAGLRFSSNYLYRNVSLNQQPNTNCILSYVLCNSVFYK